MSPNDDWYDNLMAESRKEDVCQILSEMVEMYLDDREENLLRLIYLYLRLHPYSYGSDRWLDKTIQRAATDGTPLLMRAFILGEFDLFSIPFEFFKKPTKKNFLLEDLLSRLPGAHKGMKSQIANCLKSENILTLEDLISKEECDLRRIPKFGKDSIRALKYGLLIHGFHLKNHKSNGGCNGR